MSYFINDKIRKYLIFLIIFNLLFVVISSSLIIYDLKAIGIFLIIFLCLFNIFFLVSIIKYMYYELFSLSDLVEKAINGNHKFTKINYEEGILSGLKLQFATLFTRLDRTSNKLHKEKEKMSKLITELSHQIKTPISSIKLFNTLLQDDIDNDNRYSIIKKMELEIDKLEWFSKVLLDISKLETGLINLDTINLSIEDLLSEAIGSVYPKSLIKGVEIKGDIEDFTIKIDKKWTKEAIINILDNAIKYTAEGGKVTITTKSTHIANKIFISDTGRGIHKEDIPFIFNRFYKGKNTRTEEGTGIGLYLAKEIVEMQNGTIKVSTKLNQGTTFEIVFYK